MQSGITKQPSKARQQVCLSASCIAVMLLFVFCNADTIKGVKVVI